MGEPLASHPCYEMKKLAFAFGWIVGGAYLYEVARSVLPFTIVITLAFVSLWYAVRHGTQLATLAVADLDGERPYLVAAVATALAFVATSYTDYLFFETQIWQSTERTLPPGTGFFDFIALRARAGYGELVGSKLLDGRWPTLLVWVAWTGILALAALAGAGRALRKRRNR